jgi:hypothetical protein
MFQLTLVSFVTLYSVDDYFQNFAKVVPSSSDVYTILAYAAAAATQIFMYCWFGNQVELKVRSV